MPKEKLHELISGMTNFRLMEVYRCKENWPLREAMIFLKDEIEKRGLESKAHNALN